ncbi:hypothetical protein ACI2LO_05045 [Streptomyces sp. NPDC033754]|uniref:hypothetical protein n=1 Tax=Streptomyces sp. NPDC033754 TaxID=3365318 RepID=UPI00384AD00A
MLLGLAVLRHTQSNSACYVRGGATLGIAAGQRSRGGLHPAGGREDRHVVAPPPPRRPRARLPAGRPPPGTGSTGGSGSSRATSPRTSARACPGSCPYPPPTSPTSSAPSGRPSCPGWRSPRTARCPSATTSATRTGTASASSPNPGGSIRSADVEDARREHGITLARTGPRLFHH